MIIPISNQIEIKILKRTSRIKLSFFLKLKALKQIMSKLMFVFYLI